MLKKNVATVEQVNVQVENDAENASNEMINVSYQNCIKKLIAAGCKRINSVKIKNVNFTEKDNYTMISFTLSTPIRGFVSNDNGITYQEDMTNTLFTSLYAIVGAIKEDDELGWMANALLDNPQALNLIFNGGSIDILQQEIAAGEQFTNPFSTRNDAAVQVYDHDVIINHIIGFKLGKTGEKMAARFADKLMGF